MSCKYLLIRHNLFTPRIISSFDEFPTAKLVKAKIDGYDFMDIGIEDAQLITEGEHICPYLAITYFLEKNLKC